MLTSKQFSKLGVLLASVGLVTLGVFGLIGFFAFRPSPIERFADSVDVQGFRKSETIRASDYLIETYWVGPAGADLRRLVTAPHLRWQDELGIPSSTQGFTQVADATAFEFTPYCNIQVFRVDRGFWTSGGRDLRRTAQDAWGLSTAEADEMTAGRLDVVAVLVDSC